MAGNLQPAERLDQQQQRQPVAGAPRPALCITERWIRERLNLQLDSLQSVRSLALPGNYKEKITHLGRSLFSFSKLKHIDLSRNAIESLQGLEKLKHLETLNLYYNNISSLKDLFLLRHNSKLKELDLRLNPVTRTEPDHRLFVIHMLVHLRTLDERGVVDSERRAALMHFNTDQAYQMEEGVKDRHKHSTELPTPDKKHRARPRTEMIQSLAPPSALQDNTDELLELIRRSDHLVTPVKQSLAGPHATPDTTPAASPATYTQYTDTPPRSVTQRSAVRGSGGRVRLEYRDEAEAYADYTVNVNFTPAPQPSLDPAAAAVTGEVEGEGRGERGEGGGEGEVGVTDRDLSDVIVPPLIDLIQQYVSTDITFLNRDGSFKGAVRELWGQTGGRASMEGELAALRQRLREEEAAVQTRDTQLAHLTETVSKQEDEAAALGAQLQAQNSELQAMKQDTALREEMTHLLQHANTDISSLQQHVHSLQEENGRLKAALDKAPKTAQLTKLKNRIGQLEAEKGSVESELRAVQQEEHSQALGHTQLQELASMLQESHRSLVATNDHLLRELEVAKLKHSQEIAQMHQNYQHLKKTLKFVHP